MTRPISGLLSDSRRAEVELQVEGGALVWKGGRASPELIDEIDSRQSEVVACIEARDAASKLGAPRPAGADHAPVASLNQESWYHLVQAKPKATFHRVTSLVNLKTFDADRFRSAARRWVEAFPILRSRFQLEDGAVVVSELDWAAVEAAIERGLSKAKSFDIPADPQLVEAAMDVPVSLAKPLFEFRIVNFRNGAAIGLIFHHIICDARSADIYRDRFLDLYQDEAQEAGRDSLSYQDYALWQRKAYTPAIQASLRAYWSAWAAGAEPLSHPLSGDVLGQRSGWSWAYAATLQTEVYAAFRAAAHRLRTSEYILCLAGALSALSRWSGQANIGCLSVGDLRSHPNLRESAGLFTCLDPLRVDLSDSPAPAELVARLTDERMLAMRLRLPPMRGDWPASQTRLLDLLPLQANSFTLSSLGAQAAVDGVRMSKAREVHKIEDFSPVNLIFCAAPSGVRIELQFNASWFSEKDQKDVVSIFEEFLQDCLMGGSDAENTGELTCA